MLSKLLDKKTCANCRICCGFDKTDIWELPVMTKETVGKLLEYKPETEFLKRGEGFVTNPGKLSEDELYYCPALDHEKGCVLGEYKPFDCLIWPFRVMSLERGELVITLSPVCPELFKKSMMELWEFVKEDFKNKVFDYARKNPSVIKEYIPDYPILAVEK